MRAHLAAVPGEAGGGARQQRDRRGGVRDLGAFAEEQQRREGEDRAAAGERVHHPRARARRGEGESVERAHAAKLSSPLLMPILIHRTGPQRGQRFVFERNVILGRGPLADLEVHDPAVSRRHALVTLSDGRCFLSDLESGNGTFLNSRRLSAPEALGDGDEVRVGSSRFEFQSGATGKKDEVSASRVSFRESEARPGSKSRVLTLAGLRTHAGKHFAAEVAQLQRRLDFFHVVGKTLARNLDEPSLMAELLAKVMEVVPQADRAFVVLYDEETKSFTPCAARTRSGVSTEIAASRTLLEETVRKREALVSIDAGAEEEFRAAHSVHLLNLRAVACVPLTVEDRVLGVLQLDNGQHQRGFGEADLDLLAGIAGPLALALEHARYHRQLVEREILEHDLALARRIQQSFLPERVPEIPGWKLAVEYSPAHAVGGDLYDLAILGDGRLAVAIGDVSGKGVSGALLMARITSALRASAMRLPHPGTVLEELNELLRNESDTGMFVTLTFGVLDPASGRMELANAGHLRPVLRHPDGRTGEVRIATGTALGVKRPLGAETFQWTLQPGDLLVFSTDGLTEAATPAGERFDTPRVIEEVKKAGSDPKTALDALLRSARAFVADRGFDDDLTVLCLGRG